MPPAAALLPGLRLEAVTALRGGTSAQVQRVVAYGAGSPVSLVVKAFASAGEAWAREAAALSVLAERDIGARLVAEADDPPVVVMTDLGPGHSLADRLLGDDAAGAAAATEAWAIAIAGLHGATLADRDRFRDELDRRAGDLPITTHTMPAVLVDAAAVLEARCASLAVAAPVEALDELRGLVDRLPDDDHAALTPADACPDNNVEIGDDLVLVDFEGAEFRHIAWDVAYLSVPWPSCWCSWRLPDGVVMRAHETYREVLAPRLPYVATDQFSRDVEAAAVGWAFVSTSWFLTRALADDPPIADATKVSPPRRAMILQRLGAAAESTELPSLAELASRLRAALVQRWGEVPLGYAPALR